MFKSKEKIDNALWALIWLLPFLAYAIQYYRSGTDITMLNYVNSNYTFTWIKNILDQIWNTAFGCDLKLSGYLSYLVMVEIGHCLFDVMIFIPRFAHELIEKGTTLCKNGKS